MKPVLPLTKIEKVLIAILCLLGAFIAAGMILLVFYSRSEKELLNQSSGNAAQWETVSLDDITGILPDSCNLNEKIPDISFLDENGKKVSVRAMEGKPTILTFWASWCPDCRQELALANKFFDSAKKYGDINYILVNNLDNEKDTKEQARQYLSREGLLYGTY